MKKWMRIFFALASIGFLSLFMGCSSVGGDLPRVFSLDMKSVPIPVMLNAWQWQRAGRQIDAHVLKYLSVSGSSYISGGVQYSQTSIATSESKYSAGEQLLGVLLGKDRLVTINSIEIAYLNKGSGFAGSNTQSVTMDVVAIARAGTIK